MKIEDMMARRKIESSETDLLSRGSEEGPAGPAGESAEAGGGNTPLVLESTGEIYEYSRQVGHLLRKAYQRHTAIFQQMCIDPQLTSVQLAVLCALADQGPGSLTVLGRATAIDPATMRGIVERLKARDFVYLKPDPTDGRKVIVALSDSGRDMVFRMLPHSLEITRRTLDGLTVAEQVALNYLLMKISG